LRALELSVVWGPPVSRFGSLLQDGENHRLGLWQELSKFGAQELKVESLWGPELSSATFQPL